MPYKCTRREEALLQSKKQAHVPVHEGFAGMTGVLVPLGVAWYPFLAQPFQQCWSFIRRQKWCMSFLNVNIIVWPWMETTNTEMLKIYPDTSIESNRPICKVVLCCHKIINHCWTTEWDCLSDELFPRYFGNQIACHNTSQNTRFRVKKGIYFWVEACHCLP